MTNDIPEKFLAYPISEQLDARGLHCPLPLLKARQSLRALEGGQCLLVLATDPGSWRDFAAFAEQSGHTLLEAEERDGMYCYLLQHRIE